MSELQHKMWCSPIPKDCQLCKGTLGSVFYDASTPWGWAITCHACFITHGLRLGLGRGQKYNRKTRQKMAG